LIARGGLAVAAACALLAGCGGGSHKPAHAGTATTSAAGAATVRSATCNLWRVLGSRDRRDLVAGMRRFFAGQTDEPGARGSALSDARAMQVFDGYCARSFAGPFRLYIVYGRAAAFTPQGKG
jgi:hypothetical protein